MGRIRAIYVFWERSLKSNLDKHWSEVTNSYQLVTNHPANERTSLYKLKGQKLETNLKIRKGNWKRLRALLFFDVIKRFIALYNLEPV